MAAGMGGSSPTSLSKLWSTIPACWRLIHLALLCCLRGFLSCSSPQQGACSSKWRWEQHCRQWATPSFSMTHVLLLMSVMPYLEILLCPRLLFPSPLRLLFFHSTQNLSTAQDSVLCHPRALLPSSPLLTLFLEDHIYLRGFKYPLNAHRSPPLTWFLDSRDVYAVNLTLETACLRINLTHTKQEFWPPKSALKAVSLPIFSFWVGSYILKPVSQVKTQELCQFVLSLTPHIPYIATCCHSCLQDVSWTHSLFSTLAALTVVHELLQCSSQ